MELTQSFRIFKALSDPSRLLIINSLLSKAQYVQELSKRLNLSVSTVSFHLSKLEDANLVYKVKDQYYTILHLNRDIFNLSLNELISFNNTENSNQEDRLKRYAEKVLYTYFRNGVLQKIPSQYKKRTIILEAFLSLFEPEKIYAEQEVDQKIKEVFDDYCTIRRYMIDENMMFRKRGKYTLNEKYKFDSLLPVKPLNVNEVSAESEPNNGNKKMDDRIKIKKQYKLSLRPMGVYQLQDTKNNKIYIGASKNLEAIFNRHNFELSTGMHQIKEVQEIWNTLGKEGIKLEILAKLEPKEDPVYDYSEDLKGLLNLWVEKLKGEGKQLILLNGTMIKKIVS